MGTEPTVTDTDKAAAATAAPQSAGTTTPHPEHFPELLSDPQAGRYLGVQPRTLRLWRRTRALPHLKLTAKCIRYRKADLDGWLDNTRTVIG